MDIDLAALRMIEADKGIPVKDMIDTIRQALLSAYRHTEGHQPHASIDIDEKTGAVSVIVKELMRMVLSSQNTMTLLAIFVE